MDLQHMNKKIAYRIAAFVLAAGLAACSTTGSTPMDAGTGNVFSSLNDLDYTATTELAQVSPSDMLEIKVFQAEELSGKVRVDSDGNISLPLIGSVKVAGLTPIEVENKLKSLLAARYLQNPQVTVFVEDFSNQRVTLEGQIKKPGVFPITSAVTVLQAIAMSEGLSDMADPKKVVLFRRVNNQTRAYNLNLDAIRDGKMRDPYVRGDDRIVVHRSDSRYWLKEVTGIMRGIISPLSY